MANVMKDESVFNLHFSSKSVFHFGVSFESTFNVFL